MRLTQGDYSQETVYNPDPQAQAAQFEAAGARWLHVVDLEAAKTGEPQNLPSIEAICEATQLAVQVGGGVRSLTAAQRLRDVGVARVVMGTAAIENPDLVAEVAAAMPVLLSVDTRAGMVATHGWQQASSRHFSELLAQFSQAGLAAVMLTDIAQDGMLAGPNLELYEEALHETAQHTPPLPVIASGGVGSLEHISQLAALRVPNSSSGDSSSASNGASHTALSGVIVGKALYEGVFSLADLLAAAAGERSASASN